MNRGCVSVTGMGVVSAAGDDLEQSLSSLSLGERHFGPPTGVDTPLVHPVFEVKTLSTGPEARGTRTFQLAMRAVQEALAHAGLKDRISGYRVGICLGTTVACQLNDIDFYRSYRDSRSAPMGSVDRYLAGNLASAVARTIEAEGPCVTITNACSSGTDAIGVALSWLRRGLCDIALAGGADELNRVPMAGFNSLGVSSPEPCRPFDRDRIGLNLGEGAGVLVLEKKAMAEKRGMDSGLMLAGYGSAADAYHLTAPRPDGSGLEKALRRALEEAGAEPEEVCFVNAHGTATKDNDLVEATVLHRVLGPGILLLSTKGYTGHTLGAAGGIEAVFSASGLRDGWVPRSAGFENRDEALPVTPVQETTRVHGRFAASTSLAFGGSNAALVFQWEPGGRA